MECYLDSLNHMHFTYICLWLWYADTFKVGICMEGFNMAGWKVACNKVITCSHHAKFQKKITSCLANKFMEETMMQRILYFHYTLPVFCRPQPHPQITAFLWLQTAVPAIISVGHFAHVVWNGKSNLITHGFQITNLVSFSAGKFDPHRTCRAKGVVQWAARQTGTQ